VVLHVLSGLFVIGAGINGHFNWIYWIGAGFYVTMLTYQHLTVKPNDLSRVNMAFANTNGIASVVFAVFTILSILVQGA
jgi:4-hydroxybenzoate polyprenyltransferase